MIVFDSFEVIDVNRNCRQKGFRCDNFRVKKIESCSFNKEKDLDLSPTHVLVSTNWRRINLKLLGRTSSDVLVCANYLMASLMASSEQITTPGERLIRAPVRHLVSHMANSRFYDTVHLGDRLHSRDVILGTKEHWSSEEASMWRSLCLRKKRKTQRMQIS